MAKYPWEEDSSRRLARDEKQSRVEVYRLVATSECARDSDMIKTDSKEGEMEAFSPPQPQADQVEFHVWHSSKKVGTARRMADGYILVKLDAEIRVITGFILYPV
jgi:hypothetical protein